MYRTNIVSTCGTCHADAEKMRSFNLTEESPILSYHASVHGIAGIDKGNMQSATCTDCHRVARYCTARRTRTPSCIGKIFSQTCGKCREREAHLCAQRSWPGGGGWRWGYPRVHHLPRRAQHDPVEATTSKVLSLAHHGDLRAMPRDGADHHQVQAVRAHGRPTSQASTGCRCSAVR